MVAVHTFDRRRRIDELARDQDCYLLTDGDLERVRTTPKASQNPRSGRSATFSLALATILIQPNASSMRLRIRWLTA
jgi:hypothetical protein